MRARVAVFGTLGVLLTAFGVALLVVPSVGPVETLVRGVGDGDPTPLLLAASLVAGLYVVVAARSRAESGERSAVDEAFEGTIATPPEEVTAERQQLVGGQLDRQLRAGMEAGGAPLRDARDWLAVTATHAYAEAATLPREEAQTAVERGAWTDDRVAAAFLAGPDGPAIPLSSRLRLWLAPARERRRRIERTLTAIEQVQE
ncbi:MAG: hypothetical protein V5A55_00560 [Halovenus sp.]